MPQFKFIKEKIIERELIWTYRCLIIFTFNKKNIEQVTITGHYQFKHGEIINNELILKLLEKLNGWKLEPIKYHNNRQIFKWEITLQEKRYRLIFWFKDNETSRLWIRNCYQIDNK